MVRQKADLLRGTLDLLILKTLTLEAMHGLGISRRIEQTTDGVSQHASRRCRSETPGARSSGRSHLGKRWTTGD